MARLYRIALDEISAMVELFVKPVVGSTWTVVQSTAGSLVATVASGLKGATPAALVTSTAEGVDHQAFDVQLYHGGVAMDPAREGGKLTDLVTLADARLPAIGPQTAAASMSVVPIDLTLGTSAFLAVSGVSARTADLAAGRYLLKPLIDVCYRINASGSTDAAVWCTAPAISLLAGERHIINLSANQRIEAITAGGSGHLEYTTVS